MNNLLYDLLSRMPYHIPSQQQMFLQETVIGSHKPEPWSYIEARLLNDKVLNDYKKIASFEKVCIRLTRGSQWVKKLFERKKDKFVKRMEGMLYITDHQVFFEGKLYHMCRNHNKITKVAEIGNGLRLVFGKKEEWFFVQNPKSVFQKLMQYVDKNCLLQGSTYYDYLKADGQEEDAELYEQIYFALLRFEDIVLLDYLEDGEAKCSKIVQMVLLDHPMLYYVNPQKIEYAYGHLIMRMDISYFYNQKQCDAMNAVILRRISKIMCAAGTCCGQDKEQLVKWLYTYLVQNVSYAEDELESTEAEVQCRIHSVIGAFLDEKAVCDGMARAFKLLLDELDIDNWVVRQDLKKGMKYTHEWNMILQDDEVLHADVTWERSIYEVKKQVQYDYFMLTEEEMKEKHKGYKKE